MAACAVKPCTVCPSSSSSSVALLVGSGRFHGRRGVSASTASCARAARGESSISSSSSSSFVIERPGFDSSSSSVFGSSPISSSCSLHASNSRGISTAAAGGARSRNVVCEVAVKVGEDQDTKKVSPGTRIRVKVPLTIYHVSKLPNFNLEGSEGEVKDVIGVFKGKTVSANLPVKVQFQKESDGNVVKFFAHLKDDEFEIVE